MLSSLPRLNNGPLAKCKNTAVFFLMDFHGNHTATFTALSGATKAHDWMVSVLDTLFRTAGHTVPFNHPRRRTYYASGRCQRRDGAATVYIVLYTLAPAT